MVNLVLFSVPLNYIKKLNCAHYAIFENKPWTYYSIAVASVIHHGQFDRLVISVGECKWLRPNVLLEQKRTIKRISHISSHAMAMRWRLTIPCRLSPKWENNSWHRGYKQQLELLNSSLPVSTERFILAGNSWKTKTTHHPEFNYGIYFMLQSVFHWVWLVFCIYNVRTAEELRKRRVEYFGMYAHETMAVSAINEVQHAVHEVK